MAYDESLADRLRDVLRDEPDLVEKKMFGGLAMLLSGNMTVGVHRDDLIVRTDPRETDELLAEEGARPFDITGRPMKGWLLIDSATLAEDDDLRRWVGHGVTYARRLPPK